MTEIPISDRYEINAIVERLVGDESNFAIEDARNLIRLTPPTKRAWIEASLSWTGRSSRTSGYSPGVGNVDQKGDEQTKTVKFGEAAHRIGGYKIKHQPGHIDIALMWAETNPFDDDQRARLRYDTATREPIDLQISVTTNLKVPGIGLLIKIGRFVHWKSPHAA